MPGQAYKRTAPLQVSGGPALLVYYSPAFLRTLAPDDALAALSLLAETYRRARQLWPPQSEARGSVTVRIDQIREQKLVDIQVGGALSPLTSHLLASCLSPLTS